MIKRTIKYSIVHNNCNKFFYGSILSKEYDVETISCAYKAEIDPILLNNFFLDLKDRMIDIILAGNTINICNLFTIGACLKGRFHNYEDEFDQNRHRFEVEIKPLEEFHAIFDSKNYKHKKISTIKRNSVMRRQSRKAKAAEISMKKSTTYSYKELGSDMQKQSPQH